MPLGAIGKSSLLARYLSSKMPRICCLNKSVGSFYLGYKAAVLTVYVYGKRLTRKWLVFM
jgi:hypothetical protein